MKPTHTPIREDLDAVAARLWPGDAALRAKWLEAVALVRCTSGGWLLDKPVTPVAPDARPVQCQ